jgi:hypothetical protein
MIDIAAQYVTQPGRIATLRITRHNKTKAREDP